MKQILVIDDDPIIVELLQETLSMEGFSVEVAVDSEQGFNRYLKIKCNLVITDINMPKANGNTVAEKIRKSDRPDTPVIAISGTPSELAGDAFDSVIQKPFSLDAVLKEVQKFL